MIVYRNSLSLLQLIILILVGGGLLVAGFFLTMALLPFILLVILYIWYKVRKNMKNLREQAQNYEAENTAQNPYWQENRSLHTEKVIYKTEHSTQANTSQQEPVIYDISPEDYSVEEKK